jgi:hypothetical protein
MRSSVPGGGLQSKHGVGGGIQKPEAGSKKPVIGDWSAVIGNLVIDRRSREPRPCTDH